MNDHALPSDIIYKIVCYALYTRYDEQREFKRGLEILAVCQEWRRAAMPVVYRNAYTTSGCFGFDEDKYHPTPKLAEISTTKTVDTNIDLIQSQNCVELVRKLNVSVSYNDRPLFRHDKIANILSTTSAVWPNVQTLYMTMFKGMYGSTHEDIGPSATVLAGIASRFMQLLPRVRHLMFQGSTENSMTRELYGSIAGAYNNQLEKLDSRHAIIVPSDLIYSKLKHVDISFDGIRDYQPPSINPRVLESLKMIDVFGTKYWDSFCAGEQSNVIEFSNLKKLHVSQYQHDASMNMNHNAYQMHFPCLQELYIDSYTNVLSWFCTAVLPAAMKNLIINDLYKIFTIPESFVFPVVENLTLNINSNIRASRDELLVLVNRILASTNQSSNVHLSIKDCLSTICPQDINCSNITKLFIGGPMTTRNLYAYLAKMAKLVEIKCGRLMADEDMEVFRFPDPGQFPDKNETPLNICIKTVDIRFDNPRYVLEKMVNVVKCLLLKLPNLTRLLAYRVPEDVVIDFVNAYKSKYPYLSAVHLGLDTTVGEMYYYSPDDYTTDDADYDTD